LETCLEVLEEHFQMVLANAQHIKAVPGRRKADMVDCQWIANCSDMVSCVAAMFRLRSFATCGI
jgi:hypothetical protein